MSSASAVRSASPATWTRRTTSAGSWPSTRPAPCTRTRETPLTDRHWYRTGDHVTVQDGLLVHKGRMDHQVKIRGRRIELGEIEALLRESGGVTDAIVTAVESPDGEPELCAAVSGTDHDTDELYSALAARLPRYMLPRRITVFEELPLNANGKIDRRTLASALAGRPGG